MNIRLATMDDALSLAELNREVQQLHYDVWPIFFRDPTNRQEVVSIFGEILAGPENRIFIADIDDVPEGYLYCKIVRRPINPFNLAREFIFIHHIVIRSSKRGKGYGSMLLQTAFDLARSENINQVLLDVWSFNQTAKSFFTRHGFAVCIERMRAELT